MANIFKSNSPIRVGNFASAPADVSEGAIYWDTTAGALYVADGAVYNPVSAGGSGITQLTGDVTAGPGSGSQAATLATVNASVGTFGSSTSIPNFTVNAKGLITAAAGNAVIAPAGTLSGTTLNATVVSSSLTSVGTVTSGTWNATTIAINHGGTGQTTQTAAFDALSPTTTKGDLIVNDGTNNVRRAVGTNGQFLQADSTQATGVKWAASTGITAVIDDPTPTLGGNLTLNNKVFLGTISQAANASDASFSYTTNMYYFPTLTLAGSQTNASVSSGDLDFATPSCKSQIVEYTVFDTTSTERRCGRLTIVVNKQKSSAATGFSIIDTSTETGDVGVVFNGAISGNTFNLQFTSTSGTKYMKAQVLQMFGPSGE